MAFDISKVQIGAAVVSIGEYALAGAASGTLVDVGHTKGPTTIAPTYDIYKVDSERLKVSPLGAVTMANFQLKVPIIETIGERLGIAIKQALGNITGTPPNMTVRVGDPTDRKHQIVFTSTGPAGATGVRAVRTVTCWFAMVSACEEIGFTKGGEQMYSLTFDLFYDETVTTADKVYKQVDTAAA